MKKLVLIVVVVFLSLLIYGCGAFFHDVGTIGSILPPDKDGGE